jgi:ACT domain-containing protein
VGIRLLTPTSYLDVEKRIRKFILGEFIMKKTIITVTGKDTIGIIAKVCTFLAENRINILDISQTIIQDYFHMMMIVDTSEIDSQNFSQMSQDLADLGKDIGVIIQCQKEEIFAQMHRI